MPWAKLDDKWRTHRKFVALGVLHPMASALWVAALGLSAESLLDGRIPRSSVLKLLSVDGWAYRGKPVTLDHLIAALVRVGLWEVDETGEEEPVYILHDYHDYQPSQAVVLADREKAARRMAEHRLRGTFGRTNTGTVDERTGEVHPAPDPDPDPDPLPRSDPPPTPSRGVSVDTGGSAHQLRMAGLEVMHAWNVMAAKVDLPLVEIASATALGNVTRALRAENKGVDWWVGVFAKVATIPFLCGNNDTGWRPDCFWVLDKAHRIAGGTYDVRGPNAGPPSNLAAGAAARLRKRGSK
jgi:hypothetical protein